MGFSIQWWGFSSGWRWPGHSLLCIIRARATLTVLICRSSARCRRWLRFLLKVCNNDCQISNGHFQMLSTTPIHIFQSWPGFLMTVLFASCFLFTFFFFYFIFFLFLWLCRGHKLLSNLLCNQLGDRSRFPGFNLWCQYKLSLYWLSVKDPSSLMVELGQLKWRFKVSSL